jgi:hypothetical protein
MNFTNNPKYLMVINSQRTDEQTTYVLLEILTLMGKKTLAGVSCHKKRKGNDGITKILIILSLRKGLSYYSKFTLNNDTY